MRSNVCVLLAVPAILLAGLLQPITTLPNEGPTDITAPAKDPVPAQPVDGGAFVIGVVDTIGGTTYDWQSNGPAYRQLVNSPGVGVHAAWMFSAEMSGTSFPDRNMRYNFYDYTLHAWSWIDPDFMSSGVNTFVERAGFGNLDVDVNSNVAVISSHQGDIYPYIARDLGSGSGIFEYADGSTGAAALLWPYIGVGQSGIVHVPAIGDDPAETRDTLYYTKIDPWPDYTPRELWDPSLRPYFPDQNVAASKVSEKVCVTWVISPDGYSLKAGYYRISTDGGTTWTGPAQVPWPDAYGPDTSTSFHITSLFPFYGRDDDLHFVACVAPYVRDTNYILPAEIWHWNAANTPNWNQIHRGSEVIEHEIGYNAIMSCRPSLGEDAGGNLFVAWEEFDGINYQPGSPERLRADVYWSSSTDNGQTWDAGERITDGGTVTHRFPSILDYITDTVMVTYMIDQYAGFVLYAEGPHTQNPIVVQKWDNPYDGLQEGKGARPLRMTASVCPNPFGRTTRLSYDVPRAGQVLVEVYDISGRPVKTLVAGRKSAGRHSVNWNGTDANGERVASGVYLYRYMLDEQKLGGKLLLTD